MNQEIIDLTRRLLNSITQGDWKTYTSLCDPSLTCFEPEAQGQLVEGMAFHRFYFDRLAEGNSGPVNVTIASPHVRMIGDDVAIICYNRLVQSMAGERPTTQSFEESRVWEKQGDTWKHVHFHRSLPARPRNGRWHGKREH